MRFAIALMIAAGMAGCSNEPIEPTASSSAATTSDNPQQQSQEKPTAEEPVYSPTVTTKPATAETEEQFVDTIQGKWVIVEANLSGNAADAMKGGFAVISGNEITVSIGGQETKSTLSFNEEKTPIQFDAASENGQKTKAIMQVLGDDMTVSTSLTGVYPTTFDPGPGVMVLKYKRE